MTGDNLFQPSERDQHGGSISARDLGDWGRESVIETAWEALERAETAEHFYRAAASLVFHARHLHPIEHAQLARALMKPFKRARGRPEEAERTEYIADAIRSGGPFGIHEWQGLTRSEMIPRIQAHFAIVDATTAGAAFDKAKKLCRKRWPDQAAKHDELERAAKARRMAAHRMAAKKT